MMELKGNCECGIEKAALVFPPNYKRIVEYSTVHAYCTIYFILRQCRSANHHAVCQVMVDATVCNLLG